MKTRTPKSHEIRDSLVARAQRLGPEAKLPTVQELCVEFDVSSVTMHRVLTDLEARRIIRRRQGSGIFVAPHVGQVQIALICAPSFFRSAGHSPVWDRLLILAEERATARNERLSCHFTTPDSQKTPRLHEGLETEIGNGQVQGVITVGLRTETTQWIEEQGVPVVATAGYGTFSVNGNEPEFLQRSTQALVERGCQNIAFWKGLMTRRYAPAAQNQRSRARFEAILRDCQFAVTASSFADRSSELRDGLIEETAQEQGYHLAHQILNRPSRPDGLILSDDMMTSGVLVALEELGLRAGHDLQIATQGVINSPVLWGREAGLILLEYDQDAHVDALFEMLDQLLRGETPSPAQRQISPTLRAVPRRVATTFP